MNKKSLFCGKVVLILILAIVTGQMVFCGEFNPEKYKEVKELKELKINIPDYNGDKIFFKTIFKNVSATLMPYMQKSGLKNSKYTHLIVYPKSIPVIAKRKDFSDVLKDLRKNSIVIIYGEVEKFKRSAKFHGVSQYYLELDHIEEVKKDEQSGKKEKRLKMKSFRKNE